MSRDMQIGLLLAVGFLALVGGVLYYRIEHPDDLDQYLNGASQAQATSPVTGPDTAKPDNAPGSVASNQAANTPPPANQPPPFDATPPAFANANTPSGNNASTTGSSGNAGVVLASGNSTGTVANPASDNAPPAKDTNPPAPAAAPILDFSALDKKPSDVKPLAAKPADDTKKTESASNARTSLPADPPAGGLSLPPAPASSAPNLVLDLSGKSSDKKVEEKKTDDKKPLDLVVKPDNSTLPVMTPPSMTPPALNSNPPAAAAPTMPDAGARSAPATTAPDLKKSQELPQPPVVTAPNAGILFDNKPANPPASATSSPGTNTSPLNNAVPPVNTAPPVNSTPPASTGEANGFRTYPTTGTLGKPMPESEAALREKRWADGAGNPSPIVPSSTDWRGSSNTPADASLMKGDRKVVRDTYIPTERAQRGETFSSLSQRLYGDTNYAVALAAFNKEEGFVKMDQPEANEWVAKPNREILDQRFPHLIRRLTPSNINNLRNQATMNTGTDAAAKTAAANANYPTYRVGKGEQLFEVARKTLGDGYRWSEIYALNKDLLRDSTELRPDMMLKLPLEAKK